MGKCLVFGHIRATFKNLTFSFTALFACTEEHDFTFVPFAQILAPLKGGFDRLFWICVRIAFDILSASRTARISAQTVTIRHEALVVIVVTTAITVRNVI